LSIAPVEKLVGMRLEILPSCYFGTWNSRIYMERNIPYAEGGYYDFHPQSSEVLCNQQIHRQQQDCLSLLSNRQATTVRSPNYVTLFL
jgi:hypothetical protein